MFVSNRALHILIAECKSGTNINEEQNEKYSKLTKSFGNALSDFDVIWENLDKNKQLQECYAQ